jgi:hypothetical protein
LKAFAEQLRAEFRAFEPRHGILARQESDDGALNRGRVGVVATAPDPPKQEPRSGIR